MINNVNWVLTVEGESGESKKTTLMPGDVVAYDEKAQSIVFIRPYKCEVKRLIVKSSSGRQDNKMFLPILKTVSSFYDAVCLISIASGFTFKPTKSFLSYTQAFEAQG